MNYQILAVWMGLGLLLSLFLWGFNHNGPRRRRYLRSFYVACENDGTWSIHFTEPPDGRTVEQVGSYPNKAAAMEAAKALLELTKGKTFTGSNAGFDGASRLQHGPFERQDTQ